MLIVKTKDFTRTARKENVDDASLREAVRRAEKGQIDAQLGRHLIKQRIARPGSGRSGGFRTIVFHMEGKGAVFLYLFPKNRKASLTATEENAYRAFAVELGRLTTQNLKDLVVLRGWTEINGDEDDNLQE